MFAPLRTTVLLLILVMAPAGCATTTYQDGGRQTGTAPAAKTGQSRTPAQQGKDSEATASSFREEYLLMSDIKGELDRGTAIGPEKAEQLIELAPDSSYGRFLAGMIYTRNGETENAKIQFKRSTELDRGSDHAFSALGQIAHRSGDLAQADLFYSKAHEAADTPLTANRLALLRMQGGYVESAREILENTLVDHPNDTMTRNNLAIALDLLGATSEGIRILGGDEVTDSRLLRTRALLQLKEGHPERAVQDLGNGSDAGSLDGQSLLLGIADLQRGVLDKAEEKFRSSIEDRPSDYEGYINLGLTLRRQGKFAEAAKVYQEGLTKASHPDLHLNLGVLYELYRGEPSLALEQYRQYLKLEGPASDRVRGWVEYLEGVLQGP